MQNKQHGLGKVKLEDGTQKSGIWNNGKRYCWLESENPSSTGRNSLNPNTTPRVQRSSSVANLISSSRLNISTGR